MDPEKRAIKIQSEPLGSLIRFDLGEFDSLQLKFKQPVKELVNRYSGL